MTKKLAKYQSMRDFKITSEPAGEAVGKTGELRPGDRSQFYIQRHDASHLHYDFRLLIDGTLKSWAVPKGPSLDPAVKRLAMEVEDHPASYGDFEGTIPKGEYGGGSVMLWDRGEFELLGEVDALAQLKKGDLKFRLEGEKLRGDFALVRTREVKGKRQWLLIKKKGEGAVSGWDVESQAISVRTGRAQEEIAGGSVAAGSLGVKGELPKVVAPMLATLAQKLPQGKDWAFEIKWDGVRVIARVGKAGKVELSSRNGLSYTKQFPELATLGDCFAGHTVTVDGEIVVHDEAGKPSFQALQPRLGLRWGRKGNVSGAANSAHLYLFDLLSCDGYDLRGVEFAARKAKLAELFKASANVRLSEHFLADGKDLLEAARESGLEGVMAKRLDSLYTPGRSKAWVKVKFESSEEFAICGWTTGKRNISALVLGQKKGTELVWAGNVGTGFDTATLEDLQARLEKLETAKSPFVGVGPEDARWVKPKLLAEVKFANWTSEGKLRAPVYVGLKMDREVSVAKKAGDKKREVALTHLDKVYFPEDGITKGQLIEYYDAASEFVLPYLKDRPLSLRRYPNGIHGESFFQKNLPEGSPSWLETVEIYSEDSKRMIRYAMAQNRESLLYLVNLGCIDQNPWMSRVKHLDQPDFLLIDLDPHECSFDKIVEAALYVKQLLDALKVEVYVKTSGGNGMHVVAPLAAGLSYDEVREFTASLARLTVKQRPDLFTVERAIKKRPKGRVYFDHVQIGQGKTIAAPYVVRAYKGAPVGTPLRWDEVKPGLKPGDFWMGNVLDRVKEVGDLFAPVLKKGQKLKRAAASLAEVVAAE